MTVHELAGALGRDAETMYVYGIVDREFRLPPGLDNLRLASTGRVAYVYSPFDPAELEGSGDELSETSAVSVLAHRHDSTLKLLAASGAVLPMRLGSVFASDRMLTGVMSSVEDQIMDALDRIRGRHEWDIRLRPLPADTDRAPAGASTNGNGSANHSGPGTSYLLGRRDARRAEANRRLALPEAMQRATDALSPFADEIDEPVDGRSLLRAFLVSTRAERAFLEAADRVIGQFASIGYSVGVFGPLPAYSFVQLRLEFPNDRLLSDA